MEEQARIEESLAANWAHERSQWQSRRSEAYYFNGRQGEQLAGQLYEAEMKK